MGLKLTKLSNTEEWKKKGYSLPEFNIEEMVKKTKEDCHWIHFGAGNIFRAFLAAKMQELLEKKIEQTGIIVGECFDDEIIDKVYAPHNNRTLLVTLKGNGTVEKQVIASIAESYVCQQTNSHWNRFKEIFCNPELQMVSFTITEKGYSVKPSYVISDIDKGPENCSTVMCLITALAFERFKAGAFPFAFVSMDNCSENGKKLKQAIITIAEKWVELKYVPSDFVDYLNNPTLVSFPWTMIDKITPRPDETVKNLLEKDGFEDTDIFVSKRNSWTAPYVNSEECEYLVIEDSFPNGRPKLEETGIFFTDRDTVNKVEKMKVGTCLNPLHTAMSILGCLLGYTRISDEMKDEDIVRYIKEIGYTEGLPVVSDPKIFSPIQFLNDVVEKRLPNPFVPDTPQRIAMDTSHKISIRFGQTVNRYIERDDLNENDLEFIPFFFASWLRYLLGINDFGEKFEISPDPQLELLLPYFEDIKLGDTTDIEGKITPILKMDNIWGFNLFSSVLKNKVISNFKFMMKEKGNIRVLLKQKLNNRRNNDDKI